MPLLMLTRVASSEPIPSEVRHGGAHSSVMHAALRTLKMTAQRDALLHLGGVEAERIYVDHGLTGTNRE